VVLFGDSHAAQWFPTFERLATERHWRLVSLTKSACPAADITVWHSKLARPYLECNDWRASSLERIAAERARLVVVANTHFVDLAIDGQPVPSLDREALWRDALARTVTQLRSKTPNVVILGDTPRPANDPPVCLSAHLENALACATLASVGISSARAETERSVANETQATFIDPNVWVCPGDPCPAVIGRSLVYRDTNHITSTFARALAPNIGALLPALAP
jgi:hypothetical protein